MTSQLIDPIKEEWSIVAEGGMAGAEATCSARELARVLGGLDLAEIAVHHVELAAAVADLARAAGSDWPWTHDDPTVALLRALALLAIVDPDVTSTRADALVRTVRA